MKFWLRIAEDSYPRLATKKESGMYIIQIIDNKDNEEEIIWQDVQKIPFWKSEKKKNETWKKLHNLLPQLNQLRYDEICRTLAMAEENEDIPESKPEKNSTPELVEITDKQITDMIMDKYFFYCDPRDPNQTLYVWESGGWHNGVAENVILRELSEIFKNEERRTGMVLDRTVNFIKGQSMNVEVINPPPNLIFFKNGILDIDTGQLVPHDPKYFCVNVIPWDYNPQADCPKWKKWLDEVIRQEDKAFLQEWAGYQFWRAVPEAAFTILTGTGQNGKSIWMETMAMMLGPENVTNITLADLTYDDFKPAELHHKLANIADDIGRDRISNTGRLKEATAGSPMTVCKKFGNQFNMKPYAKITYACNQPPEIIDASDAIIFRMKVVEFPYTFSKTPSERERPARDKKEILAEHEQEMSGIINWALEGLKRLKQNNFKFTVSRSTIETWKYYQRRANPVLCFIEECLEFTDDDADVVYKEEMYEAFKKWMEENKVGLKISRDKFFRELKAQEVEATRSRAHDMKRVYLGVKINYSYKVPSVPTFQQKAILPEHENTSIHAIEKCESNRYKDNKGKYEAGTLEQRHVRFLCDIQYTLIGADGKTYGPFKAGDVAEIPLQNALLLAHRGLVEILEGL